MRSLIEQRALAFLDGGPATKRELTDALETTEGVIRSVLGLLMAEGLIRVQTIRHRGVGHGSGGGVFVYSRTEKTAA